MQHNWPDPDCIEARDSSIHAPPLKERSLEAIAAYFGRSKRETSAAAGLTIPFIFVIIACVICHQLRRSKFTWRRPISWARSPYARHSYRFYSDLRRFMVRGLADISNLCHSLFGSAGRLGKAAWPQLSLPLFDENQPCNEVQAETSALLSDSATIRRKSATIRRKRRVRTQRQGYKRQREIDDYFDTSSEDEVYEANEGRLRMRQRLKRRYPRAQ
jgi:hypothetical protein